jgi:hypothetical protein
MALHRAPWRNSRPNPVGPNRPPNEDPMRTLLLISALIALSATAPSQSRKEATQVLARMVAMAEKDPVLIFDAATYAREHDFEEQATNLFKRVLTYDPLHPGANLALGNLLHKVSG